MGLNKVFVKWSGRELFSPEALACVPFLNQRLNFFLKRPLLMLRGQDILQAFSSVGPVDVVLQRALQTIYQSGSAFSVGDRGLQTGGFIIPPLDLITHEHW